MAAPRLVPDPTPEPAWPAELPRPRRLPRRKPLHGSSGALATFAATFAPDFRHGPWSMREITRRATAELSPLAGGDEPLDWQSALFLDVEAGVHPRGGSCLYLAGVGRFESPEGASFDLRQFLARDEEGERDVLAAVQELAAGATALVTFGGRSFDGPLLVARARANGVKLALPRRHFDLHRMASKLLRGRFDDGKLVTLERELLRYERADDLPGHAAPRAWQLLFDEGQDELLWAVVRHNLLDVLALPALAAELSLRLESPEESLEQGRLTERDAAAIAASLAEARRALALAPPFRLASAKARVRRLERKLALLRGEAAEPQVPGPSEDAGASPD